MLIDIGVDIAGRQRRIGLDEIAKLHQLDLQALLGRHLLGHFGNLSVGASSHANGDFQILSLNQRSGRQQGRSGERRNQRTLVHDGHLSRHIQQKLGSALHKARRSGPSPQSMRTLWDSALKLNA